MDRNLKLVVWNVCGLNARARRTAIHSLIGTTSASIVCLQETKKPLVDLAFIKTYCPKRFDKFAFVPSRGASGGILTIWNNSVFSGDVIVSNDFVLGVKFTSTISAQSWTMYRSGPSGFYSMAI